MRWHQILTCSKTCKSLCARSFWAVSCCGADTKITLHWWTYKEMFSQPSVLTPQIELVMNLTTYWLHRSVQQGIFQNHRHFSLIGLICFKQEVLEIQGGVWLRKAPASLLMDDHMAIVIWLTFPGRFIPHPGPIAPPFLLLSFLCTERGLYGMWHFLHHLKWVDGRWGKSGGRLCIRSSPSTHRSVCVSLLWWRLCVRSSPSTHSSVYVSLFW